MRNETRAPMERTMMSVAAHVNVIALANAFANTSVGGMMRIHNLNYEWDAAVKIRIISKNFGSTSDQTIALVSTK